MHNLFFAQERQPQGGVRDDTGIQVSVASGYDGILLAVADPNGTAAIALDPDQIGDLARALFDFWVADEAKGETSSLNFF